MARCNASPKSTRDLGEGPNVREASVKVWPDIVGSSTWFSVGCVQKPFWFMVSYGIIWYPRFRNADSCRRSWEWRPPCHLQAKDDANPTSIEHVVECGRCFMDIIPLKMMDNRWPCQHWRVKGRGDQKQHDYPFEGAWKGLVRRSKFRVLWDLWGEPTACNLLIQDWRQAGRFSVAWSTKNQLQHTSAYNIIEQIDINAFTQHRVIYPVVGKLLRTSSSLLSNE